MNQVKLSARMTSGSVNLPLPGQPQGENPDLYSSVKKVPGTSIGYLTSETATTWTLD
eukprot:SAG31_NODE_47489_length_240_cov_2.709220_1_plen_56_part_01